MHAIVARLRLRAGLGEPQLDELTRRADREVVDQVVQAPGFRAYYLVRAADTDVVVFHVWDTRAQAEQGSARLGALTQQLFSAYLEGPAQLSQGPVVIHRQK
jgi:heme-degrading monooxygenase HmoA